MSCNCNDICLTDLDRMEDLLSGEKYLIDGYSTFLPETSDPELRRIFTDNMNECAQDQFTVFDAMSKKGWYQTKNAMADEVNTTRTKFADLRNKMQ